MYSRQGPGTLVGIAWAGRGPGGDADAMEEWADEGVTR